MFLPIEWGAFIFIQPAEAGSRRRSPMGPPKACDRHEESPLFAPLPEITRDHAISARRRPPAAASSPLDNHDALPQLLRDFAEHFPRGEVFERPSLKLLALADKKSIDALL